MGDGNTAWALEVEITVGESNVSNRQGQGDPMFSVAFLALHRDRRRIVQAVPATAGRCFPVCNRLRRCSKLKSVIIDARHNSSPR